MPFDMAGTWGHLVLVTAGGLVLIAFDVFVLPGVGPVGLTGAVLLGLALAFGAIDLGWVGAATVVAIGVVGIAIQVWLARRLRPWARFVLTATSGGACAGATAHKPEPPPLGRRGVVTAALHPVGRVRFDDGVTDARSEGEYVGAGVPVEQLRVEGGRPVVTVCRAVPRYPEPDPRMA